MKKAAITLMVGLAGSMGAFAQTAPAPSLDARIGTQKKALEAGSALLKALEAQKDAERKLAEAHKAVTVLAPQSSAAGTGATPAAEVLPANSSPAVPPAIQPAAAQALASPAATGSADDMPDGDDMLGKSPFTFAGNTSCDKWLAVDLANNADAIGVAAAAVKDSKGKLASLRAQAKPSATDIAAEEKAIASAEATLRTLYSPSKRFLLKDLPEGEAGMASVIKSTPTNLGIIRDAFGALDRQWKNLGEFTYFESKDDTQEFVLQRREVADCAQLLFQASNALTAVATNGQLTPNQQLINTHVAQVRNAYVEIAHRDVFDRPQLSAFVGPGFTLEADGDLKTGAEALILFDGGAGSLGGLGRSFLEFGYQSIGSVDTAAAGTAAPEVDVNDLFRRNKGYFRFNAGGSASIGGRYSVATTFGLTSVLGTGDSLPESLRERYVISGLTRNFLSDGVYTRFSAGIGYDKYWRYDRLVDAGLSTQRIERQTSFGRFVVNGEIQLPSAQLLPNWVSGAMRFSLDTPLNGDGPSEVRVSVLAYVNFNDFFTKLNPIYRP